MENSASLVVFSIIAVASGRPQRDTLPLFGQPQQPPAPQQHKINGGALALPDISSSPYVSGVFYRPRKSESRDTNTNHTMNRSCLLHRVLRIYSARTDTFCQSHCSDPQEHIDNGANPGDAPSFAGNPQGTCNYNGLPGCRTLCNNERTVFKHLHMQARRQ